MKSKALMAGAAGFAVLALWVISTLPAGSKPASDGHGFTANDYIEIQQLVGRYPFAIDVCSNNGYDYADLYTDDGQFSVSNQWGGGGTRTFVIKGREALAKVAGGGPGGCKDPKSSPGFGISHISVNTVITPTFEGATGRSYLLAIGIAGDPTKIERQGGYEDVYVKTPAGWRFKTRTHVWPNMADSVQMKARGTKLPASIDATSAPSTAH